ncbi:MAG: fluoride efflux transporter CrcB [Desulfocucumaceae bacterium]
MELNNVLLVGAGGFLGASARYLLGKYINSFWKGSFPLGTFIINISGSFLLGLMVFHPFWAADLSKEISLGLGVGFLGAFTTFSTFEYETIVLLEKRKTVTAIGYVLLSFILGIAAAWLTKVF